MNGMETVDPNIVRQCCRPRMQQAYLEIILYHYNMKDFPTHQGGTSSILYMRSLCLDPVSLPASFTVSSRDASMSSVLFEVFLLEPPESFQKQNSSLLHVILSQKIELLKINHKLILFKNKSFLIIFLHLKQTRLTHLMLVSLVIIHFQTTTDH